MKACISFSVVALLWTNTLGANPPRSAARILEEFEAAKSPPFDLEKREDTEYVRKYLEARKPLEAAKQPVVYKVMMLRDRFAQDVKAHDGCGEAGPGVDRD